MVDPEGSVPFPQRDGQALEEVSSTVRGRDAQTLTLKAANAGDGVDGSLTPSSQSLSMNRYNYFTHYIFYTVLEHVKCSHYGLRWYPDNANTGSSRLRTVSVLSRDRRPFSLCIVRWQALNLVRARVLSLGIYFRSCDAI